MSDEGGAWTKGHEMGTQYAIEVLRALVLVNGGAVVAILSFAGSAGTERIKPALVASSLAQFAAGLFFALLTMVLAFLAQGYATHDRDALQSISEKGAIGLAFVSICMFGWGAYTAREGFNVAEAARPTPAAFTCETAVEFIRAQADAGSSRARNPENGSDAVLVRGGWVVLPKCR